MKIDKTRLVVNTVDGIIGIIITYCIFRGLYELIMYFK